MSSVNDALQSTRSAVEAVLAAAEASGESWAMPRAPGKWSPAQIVEHIARSLEESANVASGALSKFPTLPSFVRPFVRTVFFNRVLRNQAFPKARTTKPMNPAFGPETPNAGRARLEEAFHKFDHECRSAASRGPLIHTSLFGSVAVIDYIRFQDLHTRHHRRQMADDPRVEHSMT